MKNPRNLLSVLIPLLLLTALAFLWDGGAAEQGLPASTPAQVEALPPSVPSPKAEAASKTEAAPKDEASPKDEAAPKGEAAPKDEISERAREIAQDYTLTEKEFERHIMERHGPDSTDPGKSKFLPGFNVRGAIEDALTGEGSVIQPNTNGRDGYLFEKTYEEPIGTDSKGREIHTIRVVMGEDGFVVTAFPVK